MNFETAIKTLNNLLEEKQPEKFSSSWIFYQSPSVYHFFRLNFRTEVGDIDWDIITISLNRGFAKRWVRYKRKPAKLYEDQNELDLVTTKYREKYYTFLAVQNDDDRFIRDRIIITLVRLAQKGNILAGQELIKWLGYIVYEWIDKYYPLFKWKGYTDEIEEKISGCIWRYKYTGSFLGYLFKTLEYSARGKQSLQVWSLDDHVGDSGKTMIDFVSQNVETGELKIFGK